jgi:pyruvate dehydrogenase E1 component alpha subunit
MAAPKSVPPSRPPSGLSGGKSSLPLIRAGMGDPALAEVVAWTDDEYRRATGLYGVLPPAKGGAPAIDAAVLRDALRTMTRMRALDERARGLADAGRIGSYAGTRGIEAAVVGAAAALAADDVIAPGRRHASGAALWRGLAVAPLAAQLYGNAHDPARGHRLPGCPALPRALNILPASPHAATQLPHAAGVAWAAKMQKKPTVALGYLDAPEIDAEDFHTGLNFAAVFRLPVVFVCVNDRPSLAMKSETIAVRALAYGLDGLRVDGGDLPAVYASVRAAAERARGGGGATLIEAVVAPDGDGIARLGTWLAGQKILDGGAQAELARAAEAEVRAALAAEEPVGPPPAHAVIEHVVARPSPALQEQLDDLDRVRGRGTRS